METIIENNSVPADANVYRLKCIIFVAIFSRFSSNHGNLGGAGGWFLHIASILCNSIKREGSEA